MSERLRDQVKKELNRATSYDRAMIPTTEVIDIIKRMSDAGEADYDHGFRAGVHYEKDDAERRAAAPSHS